MDNARPCRLELGRCTAVQSDNLAEMLLRPGKSEAKAIYYEAEAKAEKIVRPRTRPEISHKL